ncbi:MAG: hypothetical protein ACOCWM_01560 [Cyclobacteriaceae bacterium]
MEKRLLIPKLSGEVDFHKFSSDSYFVHQTTYDHRIKITDTVYSLLLELDGKKNLEQIASDFCMEGYDIDILYNILFEKLGKYGIVEGLNIDVKKKEKPSYLKLSVILLPEKVINKITPYLRFLFVPRNIKLTLLFSSLIIIIGAISNINTIVIQDLEAIWIHFMIFGILSVTFHELGHVTAANFFGAKHGGIGGGFYLFSPVYFADVTDIWKLPSRQRIVVNLAGIYFELIICSIYMIVGVIFQFQFLSVIAVFIVLNTLLNLNPFLRSDGYWILTDVLEIPNLYKKSAAALREVFKGIGSGTLKMTKKKTYLLAVYGSVNYLLIAIFLYYVLIIDPISVFYFPVNLYNYIVDVYNGYQTISISSLIQFVLPFFFYYMLFQYIKFGIKRYKQKHAAKSS